MSTPAPRPKRKNPILRTRLPTLPPGARSRFALGLTAAAALGRFELQVCRDCGAVQYPPREACHRCLGDRLAWTPVDGAGELIADTRIHISQELYFRERAPWRMGLVRLDCGPTVVAHVHGACAPPPARVRVANCLDRAGQAVLAALPAEGETSMSDDRHLRELTCDPRNRKILVTDGKTAVAQAIIDKLVEAGAEIVWVGHAEPWKKFPGFDRLKSIPAVTLMPLDVTDGVSVRELAGQIGFKTDILINTAEYHRAFGIAARAGVEVARAEMDVNYLGLLRLAQEFGPVMRGRGADGVNGAAAWVNLLSIFALSNYPPHGTFSASKAAALSLAQCLRAEMLPAGIRVINVFPGPIEDEWNQLILPPKLSPVALAAALTRALKDSVEDVYPGDIAQDWLARWRDNPKALERELATDP
jgi:NAD(P)-dependent dehydrogenase (short-subunit alcohol dehydrogenase family)/uncharacterized OB-fold protein